VSVHSQTGSPVALEVLELDITQSLYVTVYVPRALLLAPYGKARFMLVFFGQQTGN
jgi:hypothetical protein